ncbi:ATP-binding protein [Streptomyces sp. NPDC056656]|uniref:ATP-binding protein n=1 Tax=Streptomyces sp. NPDC056656 TaxID=3345895 RepID=UPI0036CF6C97
MKLAIRHIVDNLVWSTSGEVWAIWSLPAEGSRYMSDRTRDDLHARITELVRSLPGAARLYGLCARQDPGEVIARAVQGVDYKRRPFWAEVADAQLRLLAGDDLRSPVEMHRRTLWLAVPLDKPSVMAEVSAAFATAWAELARTLGLPPAPVPAHEVADCQQRARQLAAELGGGLNLRPALPAEIVWMHQHALARGLDEPLLAEAERSEGRASHLVGGVLRAPSHADLGHARLLEGGTDDAKSAPTAKSSSARSWKKKGTSGKKIEMGRRWLQVDTDAGTSYQAHLALAEQPRKYLASGADLFAGLEHMSFPVDWVVDVKVVSAEKVVDDVKKKKRDLVDQAEQYAAQAATGLPDDLHDAAEDLGDLGSRASRTSVEVEVQAVTVMSVWADTAAECDRRAGALKAKLRGNSYRLERPVGEQGELFALGLPATPAPPKARQYAQHQLGEDWAMHGAIGGHTFGDPTGAMIGFSQDHGTASPVLLDIANAPNLNASASFGIAGDLGGGKSVLLKEISSAIVDRGGRVIAIDRTKRREWASFARSAAAGRCQVVDAAKAELSIDPLRVFADPNVGARYALSYLTVQLNIGPMTQYGALLKRAVVQAAAAEQPCMAQVLTALDEIATGEGARAQNAEELVEWLRVAADEPLAAAIFDPALPPLDLTSGNAADDFVVITTAGLTLPPREAATQPDLLSSQPIEALIGRAMLYLIAAIAREVAFTDPRFTLLPLDEAYWLTSSAEGQALVDEVVYDGRKHGAGVGLGCHDVRELGTSTTAGLLAYRFVSRTTDPELAARALEWLGLPGTDEQLLATVMGLSPFGKKERAGEILARDPRLAIGRFKVLVPAVERLLADIFTNPEGPDTEHRPGRGDAPVVEHALAAAP